MGCTVPVALALKVRDVLKYTECSVSERERGREGGSEGGREREKERERERGRETSVFHTEFRLYKIIQRKFQIFCPQLTIASYAIKHER